MFRRGITAHCLAAIGRVAKAEGAGGSASSAAQIIDLYALVYNKCPLTNDTASWEELGRIFTEMVVLGIEPLMRAHGIAKFSGYVKFLGTPTRRHARGRYWGSQGDATKGAAAAEVGRGKTCGGPVG